MKGTVLVIDDDTLLRQTIRFVLESKEYTVLEAPDGHQGFLLAQQRVPDFVLLDVRMSEMHGYATAQALKEEPLLCHIPIILMTGFASDLGRKRGRNAGADYYLAKPFSASSLLNLLAAIPAQHNAVRFSPDVLF